MKKLLISLLATLMLFGSFLTISADTNNVTVSDYAGLKEALTEATGDTVITLQADISNVTETIEATNENGYTFVIDLNGHNIEGSARIFWFYRGTIDIKGKGTISRKGGIEADSSSTIRIGYGSEYDSGTNESAKLTVGADVTIFSDCSYAVSAFGGSTKEEVHLYGALETTNENSCALAGNGLDLNNGADMHIYENASIKAPSKSTAVYHPQVGLLEIKGGTIVGGTGVEIRAGELKISGGIISSNATDGFNVEENGNGTTTVGVGIAVSQHTTKKDITVDISSGIIEGNIAMYVVNPQQNENPTYNLSVSGGEFIGTDSNYGAISFNLSPELETSPFINGGSFSSNVIEYVDNDASTIGVDGTYYVGTSDNMKQLASKATRTVEVLKGVDVLSVPEGVKVTNSSDNIINVNGVEIKLNATYSVPVTSNTPVCAGSKDKNCDGVVTCDEEKGEGWTWNNELKVCEYTGKTSYTVVNTAAK